MVDYNSVLISSPDGTTTAAAKPLPLRMRRFCCKYFEYIGPFKGKGGGVRPVFSLRGLLCGCCICWISTVGYKKLYFAMDTESYTVATYRQCMMKIVAIVVVTVGLTGA